MINVALKEGWAGGPRLSQKFRAALQAAGYTISEPHLADVVIAHSTACFDLTKKSAAGLFILIGPPYWPGKDLLERMVAKERADSKLIRQSLGKKAALKKLFWEAFYIAAKPGYSLSAIKNSNSLSFLEGLKDKRVIIVRNDQDKFCSPDVQLALNSYSNVSYVQLPGEHDDYYTNPQPYIDLVAKTYNQVDGK